MASLVAGNYYTDSVCQITDTGILQTVKHVCFRQLQCCTDLIEVVPDYPCRDFLLPGLKPVLKR